MSTLPYSCLLLDCEWKHITGSASKPADTEATLWVHLSVHRVEEWAATVTTLAKLVLMNSVETDSGCGCCAGPDMCSYCGEKWYFNSNSREYNYVIAHELNCITVQLGGPVSETR